MVRLALASVIQRLPDSEAWSVIEQLSRRAEDKDDRNIPALLWHGMAPLMAQSLDRAITVARETRMPQLADWAYWYAATLPGSGLQRSLDALSSAKGAEMVRRMSGLVLALNAQANLEKPPQVWEQMSSRLYAHADVAVQRQAEFLGAVMGDRTRFPELRRVLANSAADKGARLHAFHVLSRALDLESLPSFLALLSDEAFRMQVLPMLARFKDDRVATRLIEQFGAWSNTEQQTALGALTSRASFGVQLLDAVASGKVKREHITTFHVRQLGALKSADVDARLKKLWGRLTQTSSEKVAQINQVSKMFDEAPLWAFDAHDQPAHRVRWAGWA